MRVLTLPAAWILLTVPLHAATLTPVWIELAEGGKPLARVVVEAPGDCPSIKWGSTTRQMELRTPVPDGFRPACELVLPDGVTAAKAGEQALALPRASQHRVLVFGDTGCRIKGASVQECNDPAKWPFEQVSKNAANERPDLVIHVGDYLYREDTCPPGADSKCGGTPFGDRWETWDADFFSPAAELLPKAPWVFVRGNHEDCKRAWRGWFYYLEPRPWSGTCEAFTAPYVATRGKPAIVVFDSASASENEMAASDLHRYTEQFASLSQHKGATETWLVAHHPIWGLRSNANGEALSVSPGLEEAWLKGAPSGVEMILSGHIHLFELLTYDDLPLQLVAGIGGTQLAVALPKKLAGTELRHATVMSGKSGQNFGYVILNAHRTGWDLTLKDAARSVLERCRIEGRAASCGASASVPSGTK